jgi:DNA-binding PadR family transcriptional regulator
MVASLEIIADDEQLFCPEVPWTVRDTGLSQSLLEHLIFNILYTRRELSGRVLADTMGLSFSVIEPLLNELKLRQLLEVTRSMGYGLISSDFTLSEAGRKRARELSEINQYAGPAPVPIGQYVDAVEKQRLRTGWLTPEVLSHAYQHMVSGSVNPRASGRIYSRLVVRRGFVLTCLRGSRMTAMLVGCPHHFALNLSTPFEVSVYD